MKKNILLIAVIILGGAVVKAQNANADALSNKIAERMKDSLNLTPIQKEHIKDINLKLHDGKREARVHYLIKDSLSVRIQKIENTRDSLYKRVLSENQFILYRQKKRNLVTAN